MEIHFSKNIKYLRTLRNLTQAEIAERFDCTPPTVTRWEVGDSYPRFAELIQLREFFDVDLERLVFHDLALGEGMVQENNPMYKKSKEMIDNAMEYLDKRLLHFNDTVNNLAERVRQLEEENQILKQQRP
jgi:transcriptional regulator with XRE-family HTH domain